jgi:hypothetical protein
VSRWSGKQVELYVGADHAGAADLPAELLAGVHANKRVAVTVADSRVRYFLLAPPEGVASLRDCRLLLDARFESLYGHPPHEWVLQADWQAGRPMLACAMPRALLHTLASLRPVAVRPHLLVLWNRHCARLPATGVLCASRDGMANLLYWEHGIMRLVRQQRHTGAGDPEALQALLSLELARLEAEPPGARFWSGERAPPGWTALEGGA